MWGGFRNSDFPGTTYRSTSWWSGTTYGELQKCDVHIKRGTYTTCGEFVLQLPARKPAKQDMHVFSVFFPWKQSRKKLKQTQRLTRYSKFTPCWHPAEFVCERLKFWSAAWFLRAVTVPSTFIKPWFTRAYNLSESKAWRKTNSSRYEWVILSCAVFI